MPVQTFSFHPKKEKLCKRKKKKRKWNEKTRFFFTGKWYKNGNKIECEENDIIVYTGAAE